MAFVSSSPSLVYKVERNPPELIPPAEPTPYEFKPLSDIDDQKGFRKQNPVILFYRGVPGMEGRDPVKIIREAIGKTLVHYYPFAGRIREGPNDKLVVECTGEGIMFIEANAYVRLDQFGEVVRPPFPCVEELLYNVPGSSGILHCPLLLIQVTRLLCGGFVFGIRLNHSMSDASGLVHFMTSLGEIARGASVPLVQPVWGRELLNARDSPRVSCAHRAYDNLPAAAAAVNTAGQDIDHRCFFFGPVDMSKLRSHMPPYLQNCSNFELLTACIWKCRTAALNPNFDEEVRVTFPVNARGKFSPPLPAGFYGNGFGLTVATATAYKLCHNSLGYAVGLVKRARCEVTEEYMRSLADLLVTNGRSRFTVVGTLVVSDLTRVKFTNVDFGWGDAAYGGPTWGGAPASFFISSKNNNGDDGIIVTIDLAKPAMEKFAKEIEDIIKVPTNTNSGFIVSHL